MTRRWKAWVEYLHGQVWTGAKVTTEGYTPGVAIKEAVARGRRVLPKGTRVREIRLHAAVLPAEATKGGD